MTREEAKAKAWVDWHRHITPLIVSAETSVPWSAGFDAGWDAASEQIREIWDALARIKAILEEEPE